MSTLTALAACIVVALLLAPGDPGAQTAAQRVEHGRRLVEANCADCAGATRRGLEEGIAELERALAEGHADDIAAYRLIVAALNVLRLVHAAPDSPEQEAIYARQRATYARLLARVPDDAEAHRAYALSLDASRPEEQIRHLRRAMELADHERAAQDRRALVRILAAAGRTTEHAALAAEAACRPSRFAGEVVHGQAFERSLDEHLVFRLAPTGHPANPPGWTIEVRHRGMAGPEELSWVVTPPYRFWNPRYLDTSYGWSARDAVAAHRREFGFVTTAAEYRTAADAVRKLLWPADLPAPELEAARRALDSVRRASGTLTIIDSRVTPGADGRIDWLRFELVVCLPAPP